MEDPFIPTNPFVPESTSVIENSLSASYDNSFILLPDNSLCASGDNDIGQLGDITADLNNQIVQIDSDVKAIAAGGGQFFKVKTDNSLWGCGSNLNGQLGDGTTVSKQNFVKVADDVKFVATGKYYPYGTANLPDNVPVGYSKIVKTDNTLWEAGNYFAVTGGDNRIPGRLIFSKNTDNVKLAIRGYIIKTDNTLWEGNTMIADSVAAVSEAESGQVLIIRTDNSLWAKGYNWGAYGNGTVESSSSFIKILDNAKQISAGFFFSLLIKTDNTLWATGTYFEGSRGGGYSNNPRSALFTKIEDNVKSVVSSSSYTRIGGNSFSWGGYSLIIKTDNTLWARGAIQLGMTPISSYRDNLNKYVKITDDVKEMAAGASSFLFIKSDNSLWGGGNPYNRPWVDQNKFAFFRVINGSKSVVHVLDDSYMIKSDNTLWAIGSNAFGQYGDGTTVRKNSYTQIADNVKEIAAGYFHLLVLKNDSTVWAAGSNRLGQLGDGTTTNRLNFTKVADKVETVVAGGYHSYVLKSDHSLWGTGANDQGQLGDSTAVDKQIFTKVTERVRTVVSASNLSYIIKTDNTLWVTGYSSTMGKSLKFTKVTDSVLAVATNGVFSFIIKSGNTLWATGENYNGQLGDGTTTNKSGFVKVADNVKAVATGAFHTIIKKTDNTYWAAGLNDHGQLGDGTTINSSSFVKCKVP
jgi:alpha-tubulin suppressor-like RCC1 family protein